MWAANCEGDVSDEVGQDKGTRRLWAAFAISVLQPSLGCAVSSVPDSRFYRLCSRCPGGKKISGLYVVKLFTYSPGLSCEGTPGFIMRLPFSPSIKIRFILQDPFKCCFQPLSSVTAHSLFWPNQSAGLTQTDLAASSERSLFSSALLTCIF